jgi:ring-1,2-phenylacetyl-CoA epoxidase subunit PaaD
MGIIRDVKVDNSRVEVSITPTYSGCPAMDTIEEDILQSLRDSGYENVDVKTVLFPPWTTDWMSEEGKQKMLKTGIAPPVGSASKKDLLGEQKPVDCPWCGSGNTVVISQFGSTACKALHKCNDCLQPFDYFKCL